MQYCRKYADKFTLRTADRFFHKGSSISVISVCVFLSFYTYTHTHTRARTHTQGFLTLVIVGAAFCYAHRVVIDHIMMGATNPDGSIVPGLNPLRLIH